MNKRFDVQLPDHHDDILGTCEWSDHPHTESNTCVEWVPIQKPKTTDTFVFLVLVIALYFVLVHLVVIMIGGK